MGGPFNASFEEQNDLLLQMLTNYLNKYDKRLPVFFLEVPIKWCTFIGAVVSREKFGIEQFLNLYIYLQTKI